MTLSCAEHPPRHDAEGAEHRAGEEEGEGVVVRRAVALEVGVELVAAGGVLRLVAGEGGLALAEGVGHRGRLYHGSALFLSAACAHPTRGMRGATERAEALPEVESVGCERVSRWVHRDLNKSEGFFADVQTMRLKTRDELRRLVARENIALRDPSALDGAVDGGVAMEIVQAMDEKRGGRMGVVGMRGERRGTYHPFVDYGLFEAAPRRLPKGFVEVEWRSDGQRADHCGHRRRLTPDDAPRHAGARSYLTHDNGGRPFAVYVAEGGKGRSRRAWAYRVPEDGVVLERDVRSSDARWAYCEQVLRVEAEEVWVGTGTVEGEVDPDFAEGNSMLLRLSPSDRTARARARLGGRAGLSYVFVGECILIFEPATPIARFASPIGGNDVPYPFAIGSGGEAYLFGVVPDSVVRIEAGRVADGDDVYEYFFAHDAVPGMNTVDAGGEPGLTAFSLHPEDAFDRFRAEGSRIVQLTKPLEDPDLLVQESVVLQKEEYVRRMRAHLVRYGISPSRTTVLVPRLV